MLRAANYTALAEQNKRIDRALIGAAISFGVDIEINDEPGYAPLNNCEELAMLAKEAYSKIFPKETCSVYGNIGSGVTDMGDLSMLMPVIHPYIGGAIGKGHGEDYYVKDPERAVVMSAKWQLATLRLLLEGGCERAKNIIKSYKPEFSSKEDFLRMQDTLKRSGDRVEYGSDGSVKIK